MTKVLNTAQQLAIRGLVLTTYQEKVSRLISEIDFLFKGIRRLEINFAKKLKLAIDKEKQNQPGLTGKQYIDLVFANKKTVVQLMEFKKKEAIYAQCVILQVSGWVKSSLRSKVSLLAKHSGRSEIAWRDKVYKLGPKYSNKFWVDSIEIASNYVRHKDEWHYNNYDFDKNQKLVTRKDIIGTMKVGKPRANAQHLIDLRIPQIEIFGIGNDASMAILDKISSNTSRKLKSNCQQWFDELNRFTHDEMMKLIKNLK